MTLAADVAAAYDSTGAAWARGPQRVYERLADMLCERSPVALPGARVLDLGAGTGAATDAATRRGAEVVAVDIALGMLAARQDATVPAVVADVRRLPFASGSFDLVLAAFSLSHVAAPDVALREARRVLRAGGGAVVAGYAEDHGHPVTAAVDAAAMAAGWRPPAWSERLRVETMPLMATVDRAEAVAAAAGVPDGRATLVQVGFADLDGDDLVAWRLGMAHVAPFVASLPAPDRTRLTADARARLGSAFPPLSRSVTVLAWREA